MKNVLFAMFLAAGITGVAQADILDPNSVVLSAGDSAQLWTALNVKVERVRVGSGTVDGKVFASKDGALYMRCLNRGTTYSCTVRAKKAL